MKKRMENFFKLSLEFEREWTLLQCEQKILNKLRKIVDYCDRFFSSEKSEATLKFWKT